MSNQGPESPVYPPFADLPASDQELHLTESHLLDGVEPESSFEHDANHRDWPHLHNPYDHIHASADERKPA